MRIAALVLAAGSADPSGWPTVLVAIALVILALLLLVLVAVLVPAIWSLRQASERAVALLERASAEVSPIAERMTRVADTAERIATTVHADLDAVHQTVTHANARLTEAIGESEARVREFGAVMRLVQDEVEDGVVSVAATVRGVHAAATAFRARGARPAMPSGGAPSGASDEAAPPQPDRPRIRRRGGGGDAT